MGLLANSKKASPPLQRSHITLRYVVSYNLLDIHNHLSKFLSYKQLVN